jgi:hypothetical protein
LHAEKQEHRVLPLQCHAAPQELLLHPVYWLFIKDPEGGRGAFAFGFGLGFSLWAFWCGKLLEGKQIGKEKLLK